MAEEINSSNCNHNCSDCQANCESRTMDFTVPQNTGAKIKKIIGVVSGKGGVGKSMVTGLAAVSAMRSGMNVGIMDADITGPSIPRMFGLHERLRGTETTILPAVTGEGIKVVSSNLILDDPEAPVVTAKGEDQTALYIKQLARDNNIPIREDRPLARGLYTDVQIGAIIPNIYWKAIALVYSHLKNNSQVNEN